MQEAWEVDVMISGVVGHQLLRFSETLQRLEKNTPHGRCGSADCTENNWFVQDLGRD